MSRGVRGYTNTRRTDEHVREETTMLHGHTDPSCVRDMDLPRAHTNASSFYPLLQRVQSRRRRSRGAHQYARTPIRLRAHTDTRGWLLTVDSIAGGVLMEVEICDLDELTGSGSGRPASDSSSSPLPSISLCLFLSDLSDCLDHEALF